MAVGLVAAVVGASPAAVRPGVGVVRVASDPTTHPGAQHATAVEPDAAAAGSTVVSVFQSGRFFDGGAAAIGFSVSRDGGVHWRSGLLPGLTIGSSPPGPFARASDPVVAWDALHARWLAATLALGADSTAVTVSTSPDGAAWSTPLTVTPQPRQQNGETALDKEWLACDNGGASPFRGRCYLVVRDFRRGGMSFQTTTDGGVTWTPPLIVPVQSDVPGPELAIRPNGELVVIFLDRGANLYAIRSTDGGASFGARDQITTITAETHPFRENLLRVFPIPSAEADAAGTVYAVWFDCRFRRACGANDAVLTRSTESGWTQPRRIPLVARTARTDVVLPALGVDPSRQGRLALTYYTVTPAKCAASACRLNAWLTTSRDGGARWTPPRRLNPVPMRFAWLARTSSGRMVGDYFGSVFSGTRAVAVAAIARAPSNGRLNEAIHALSVAVR